MDDRISQNIENRGISIARVNSILSTKYINLQLFSFILYGIGVRCDVNIFKLTASAQSIYRKVYGSRNHIYRQNFALI